MHYFSSFSCGSSHIFTLTKYLQFGGLLRKKNNNKIENYHNSCIYEYQKLMGWGLSVPNFSCEHDLTSDIFTSYKFTGKC